MDKEAPKSGGKKEDRQSFLSFTEKKEAVKPPNLQVSLASDRNSDHNYIRKVTSRANELEISK